MQTLYALDSMSGETKPGEPTSILKNKVQQSAHLFTYLNFFITEVARYAEVDARNKASKHLPTKEDLNINTKIAGNELLWKTIENKSFVQQVTDTKCSSLIDAELLKKIYTKLVQSEEYADYTSEPSRDKKSEKKILEFIFNNLMLPNEAFINHVEELFINWDDDASLMQTLVMNYLSKPSDWPFDKMLSDEKWDFANNLLLTVLDKSAFTLELIKPKLKNWDADRIASLDLIILQMGVCEFLFFETIPTKVTINEYIDLAKEYSTVQSGQFINGLLDNINKELTSANKIKKINFKNSTL